MHGACTATKIPNISRMNIAYIVPTAFLFPSSRIHRISFLFTSSLAVPCAVVFLPALLQCSLLSPLGQSSCASFIGLTYMWILFISSTHKIHSLFIPSPVPFCMCDCALLFSRYVSWRFFGAFFSLLATLLNGVATTDRTAEKKRDTHTQSHRIQANQQLMLRSFRLFFSLCSLPKNRRLYFCSFFFAKQKQRRFFFSSSCI